MWTLILLILFIQITWIVNFIIVDISLAVTTIFRLFNMFLDKELTQELANEVG